MVTKDGYVKRTSIRSYASSSSEEIALKDNDYLLGLFELNTLDTLLIFTSLGNYLYVPVHELPVCVWKDLGKHISNIIKLDSDEKIISVIPVTTFDSDCDITIATKNGMIKRTKLSEFKSLRYSKPLNCMKLKDNDKVVNAFLTKYNDIFIATNKSFGLWFDINDIPVVGLRTSGVKSINLKGDYVVNVSNFDPKTSEYLYVITNKATAKRVKISEFEKTSRAKRGLLILREVKTNPYETLNAFITSTKDHIGVRTSEVKYFKASEIPIMDRYSTGSILVKGSIKNSFKNVELLKKNDISNNSSTNTLSDEKVSKKSSLKEIDDRLMTIDDFIDIDI